VVEAEHFAGAEHQQAARLEQVGDRLQQPGAAFAREVDQHVLAVDQVQPLERRARHVEQVELHEADPLAQRLGDGEGVGLLEAARRAHPAVLGEHLAGRGAVRLAVGQRDLVQLGHRVGRAAAHRERRGADVGGGDAVVAAPAGRHRAIEHHRESEGFLAGGAADAPGVDRRVGLGGTVTRQPVARDQVQRRRMTEEMRLVDGQAVDQGGPLDRAARAVEDLVEIRLETRLAGLAHARAQRRHQERLAPRRHDHAGAPLEQVDPAPEGGVVHGRHRPRRRPVGERLAHRVRASGRSRLSPAA